MEENIKDRVKEMVREYLEKKGDGKRGEGYGIVDSMYWIKGDFDVDEL